MQIDNIEYVELYPKIHLYKGLLSDTNKLYNIMKKSESESEGKYHLRTWDKWSVFGTYSQEKTEQDEPGEPGQQYDDEKYLSDKVKKAYKTAIDHYIENVKPNMPQGYHLASSSFSKYNKDVISFNQELAMNYHTDFIKSEADMPGNKFFITCTTYINDDYDGGSVEFYITDTGKKISYKPKAGEILVFPSEEPYYHGVKNIRNGEKFFIRNFIIYPFDGTKNWLENQKRQGAFNWMKKEFERCEYENPRNMIYLYNDNVISYEEWDMLQQNLKKQELENNQ